MDQEQILQMEPFELDDAIARAMGWVLDSEVETRFVYKFESWVRWSRWKKTASNNEWEGWVKAAGTGSRGWKPSKNMQEALEAMEFFGKRGLFTQLHQYDDENGELWYEVRIVQNDPESSWKFMCYVQGDIAPLAICQALLIANEKANA